MSVSKMDLFDLHSSSKMPTKTYKRKRHFTDAYSSDPRQSSPAALDDDALITRSNMKRRMLKRAKLTDTKENENKASTSGSKLPVYPPISRRAAPSTARAASQHLKENRPWRALASPFHSRRSSRASPISSPAPRKDTKSNQQHRKRSTSLKRTHSSQINPFPAAITPNSVQTHSSGVQPQYPFRRVDHDEWLARVSRSPFAPGTPLRSPSLDYAQSTPARLYARKNSADDFHNAFGLYDSFMPPTDRDLEDIIMRESDTFVAEQGTIYSDSPSATMTSTQPAQTSPANLQNLTARSNFETSSPFSAHVPAIEYVIELRGATTSPAPRTSEAPQPFRNRNRQSIANRPLVLNLPTSSPQFNNIQPSPSFSRHGSGRPHLPAPALDEALLSLKLVDAPDQISTNAPTRAQSLPSHSKPSCLNVNVANLRRADSRTPHVQIDSESDDELLLIPNWYEHQKDSIQGKPAKNYKRRVISEDSSSEDELDVIPRRRAPLTHI